MKDVMKGVIDLFEYLFEVKEKSKKVSQKLRTNEFYSDVYTFNSTNN